MIVARLAAFFRGLGLKRGNPIGVYLPSGTEACLTILAVERAGFVPSLLPITWGEEELALGLERIGAQAVVTQGVLGDNRPAELLCRVAARYYGLRFVCAFAPNLPNGVFRLDEAMLREDFDEALEQDFDKVAREAGSPDEGFGFVSFHQHGERGAMRRSAKSLLASAVNFLEATTIAPGDRILSLIVPDDHSGLVLGLAAALVSGTTLESHVAFDGDTLAKSLGSAIPTHLVAPGWFEAALAESRLTEGLASTILVHSPPVRFHARSLVKHKVVDVLALGELALVVQPRDRRGHVALLFRSGKEPIHRPPSLLKLTVEEDGSILVGGLAAAAQDYPDPASDDVAGAEWRDSGFKADLFAGMLIEVS